MSNKRLNQMLILIILTIATIALFRHHHAEIQAQNNLVSQAAVASEKGQHEITQLATLSADYLTANNIEAFHQLGYTKKENKQFIKHDTANDLTYVFSVQPSKTTDHFSKTVLSIYNGTKKKINEQNLLTTLETRTTWKASPFDEMGEY